jgi:hypothetical protein
VNEFGKKNRKFARHDVRNIGPTYRELDDFVRSKDFANIMEKVTGIPNLLYDPDYHGAGTHDNHSGQGMDAHVDFNLHPTTGYHRRINAIIYLNEEWGETWGGALEVHKNPWDLVNDSVKSYPPLKNHCVLFETNEISWHGFKKVNPPAGREISRKSFTIYMYTKERPAGEIVEKHGTIYVQDGLPENFKPGHVLTKDDIDELLANFRKRNEYLQGMYGREKKFQNTIANLQGYLAVFKLPTLGFCRQTKAPEGIFPSLLAGPAMTAEWTAVRPVTKVIISGTTPTYLAENKLTIKLGPGEPREFKIAGPFKLEIPCEFKPGEAISLSVGAEGTKSPKDAGVGSDPRQFSWRLHEVQFL